MKCYWGLLALVLAGCGGGGGSSTDEPAGDPGRLQFSAPRYSVNEDAVVARMEVMRGGGTDGAVSVSYRISGGTAEPDVHYDAVGGTLRWPAGDGASRTISVPVRDNARADGDKTLDLDVFAATGGAVLGAQRTATLTIHDNDVAARGELAFTAASYAVAENAGSLLVLIQRTGGIDGAVSVAYATGDGSAHAGSEYSAVSGRVGWLDGDDAPKGFSVPITDDAILDGDKTINLVISNPAGGAALGAQRSAVVTIRDDDKPKPGTLQFGSITYRVAETGGDVEITVVRTGGSDGAVSVSYASAGGSATAGVDYTAVSGVLNWAGGDTSARRISIPVGNDGEREGSETVVLGLSSPGGGAGIGPAATLTIDDDEAPVAGQLQFSATDFSIGENGGSASISVTRSGGRDGAVSISYANVVTSSRTRGATAGSDYTAVSGTLSWTDGDTSPKTISVKVAADAMAEPDEIVGLALQSPAGGATVGTPSTATLTIHDEVPPIAITNAFPNLQFVEPVFLTAAPGDASRIYVVERAGRILVFPNSPSVARPNSFMDISGRVESDSYERGLLGLAFDPDFSSNRHFYVNYIANNPLRTVVSRFTANSYDAADPGSEVVLLTIERGSCCHNGGWLGFGPDGKLYISSGDGTVSANAQRLDTLAGKMLRINRDGSVPADNPFQGTPGARPEIWAYGFRNPWRASFDPPTGTLWVGDVGESTREEVDHVIAGANYGWDICEGTECTGTPPQYEPPVFDYGHEVGASVTGGYVYRGAAMPELQGAYFYADFSYEGVFIARPDGSTFGSSQVGTVNCPSSWGVDAAGNLYVLSFFGGTISKLARP